MRPAILLFFTACESGTTALLSPPNPPIDPPVCPNELAISTGTIEGTQHVVPSAVEISGGRIYTYGASTRVFGTTIISFDPNTETSSELSSDLAESYLLDARDGNVLWIQRE